MTGIVERGHDDDCSVVPGKGVGLKPLAKVRVKHSGYGMSLAAYRVPALPDGDHWLYGPEALIAIARAMQERCAGVCRRYVTPYGRAGSAPDACEGAVHQVGATILSIDPEALVREYMEKK